MSYLSLLFTSVTQTLSNRSPASRDNPLDVFGIRDAAESAGGGAWGAAEDNLLPAGIASLEHWLDLNA